MVESTEVEVRRNPRPMDVTAKDPVGLSRLKVGQLLV